MGSIYPRGNVLWLRYRGPDGLWTQASSGLPLTEKKRARKMLERIEAQVSSGSMPERAGPATVASWFTAWLKSRKLQVQTWRNDDSVMRLHVLPALGRLELDAVRPKHLVELVRGWRARTDDSRMAPKSVYNAYSTVSAFFRDAALDGLIDASPCVLTKHQLGPKVDADPEWRRSALFSLAELEQLITDERVPADRRVLYALEGVAGVRHGEAAGLHWRNAVTPVPEHTGSLDMLYVAFSYGRPYPKGDACRPVPVHPVLAALLATWKLTGWKRFMGRSPKPDDLVVPLPPDAVSAKGRWRQKEYSGRRFAEDLETLGLRHRRGHDLRRTFISLARSAGAVRDVLRRATHKPPREVIEGYTTFEWPVVCAEVLKLPVKLHRTGELVEMPRAVNDGFATAFATAPSNAAFLRENLSGAPRTRTAASDGRKAPPEGKSGGKTRGRRRATDAEELTGDDDCSNVASGADRLVHLLEESE